MTSTPKNDKYMSDTECPTSPPPSTKTSTGRRGGKLARRARSFKDDFFEIISQMRSPGNQRSQSPHSPKSRTSLGTKTNGEIVPDDKNNPLRELDRQVREVQFALRHFRDVISKNKLEMLAGNGTVVLETVTNIMVLLRNCLIEDQQSSALISATSQLHQCVARLIRLCDDVVLNGSAALGRENVAQLVQAVLDAIQNLVSLARDKISQKSANNNTHHMDNSHHTMHVMDNGRASLPDIPLTPRERQILQQTTPLPPPSSTMPLSLSSESILEGRGATALPPPKPPLPARISGEPLLLPDTSPQRSSAPPLPPKRRHRTITAPNASSLNSLSPTATPANSSLGAGTTSDLASSVERLSVSPAHSAGAEDCSSLFSASNAGSLDSVLNTSQPDGDYDDDSMLWTRNGNTSPSWASHSRRESMDSPLFTSPSDLRNLQDPPPISLGGHTSRTLLNCEDVADCRRQSMRTSSSSHVSQQSSSSTFSISSETGSFTSRSFSSATKHTVEQNSSTVITSFSQHASAHNVTVVSNGNSPPALPAKQRLRAPRLPSQYDNVGSEDHVGDLDDLEPSWVVSVCSSHAGMHHGSTCTSPTDGTPPPLPLKKRHIMAYMEMFGSASREAWSAVMDPRRTMHVYSTWEKEWMRSQAAFSKENFSLTSTRSCLFASSTASSSTTVTHWPPLERVDPTTNLNATSPVEPPALPPKLSRTRSSTSPPPPLPPIYVAFTPPPVPLPLPPPSPVTPTPSHPPSTPPPQQPIYDFGRELPAPPRPPPMTAQTPSSTSQQQIATTPSTPLQADPSSRLSLGPSSHEEEPEGPSPLDEMDVTQYLVFKKPEEDAPDIRGGHLDALIVQATKANKNEDEEADFLYQEAFLTTYRTFLTPLELTRKLQRRYERFAHPVTDHARQRAARNAFSLLVRVVSDLTISDLEDELLRVLMDLIFHLLCCGDLNLARALRVKVLEKCEAKRTHNNMTHNALLTSLSIHTRQASLLDFKSEQVAEQMTLLDAELFMKIEIPEVLIWAQEQNEERSPNLTRFTEHFNKMSYWARSRILEQRDAKDRERYVVKFIKVMRHLRRANNFNSYLALLSALDSAPIRRLEWHRQITEGLKEYCALIDSSSSFRAYRQALGETQPPCIPYIGLVLQDLTFVHIGNPDFLTDGNINFSKRWQQFNIVENMKRFKKCQYAFKKQERILALFSNFDDCLCEEAMWQISETIKPRGGAKK